MGRKGGNKGGKREIVERLVEGSKVSPFHGGKVGLKTRCC